MEARKEIVCTPTATERFWKKVDKHGGGCWNWTAAKSPKGHGRFGLGGRYVMAHRYAYVLHYGDIEEDKEIHHRCENPSCVNPAHLIAVTHREHNVVWTPYSQPAINAAKTHCVRGHEFTSQNTYRWSKAPNQRCCRICRKERAALKQAEIRAQKIADGTFRKHKGGMLECPHCGRMLQGKGGLNTHLRAATCRPALKPPRPKLPPKPKPEPKVPPTHCKKGHPIIPENRRPRKVGTGSDCIPCLREGYKRHYYANRGNRIALVVECRRRRRRKERGSESSDPSVG